MRHGITDRTLRRYRERFGTDPRLTELVQQKRAVVNKAWANDLPSSIDKAIAFLGRAAEHANTGDPDAIHAIAGAAKILSEIQQVGRVIDARLAQQAKEAETNAPRELEQDSSSGADGGTSVRPSEPSEAAEKAT